jgi:hypothetical protein
MSPDRRVGLLSSRCWRGWWLFVRENVGMRIYHSQFQGIKSPETPQALTSFESQFTGKKNYNYNYNTRAPTWIRVKIWKPKKLDGMIRNTIDPACVVLNLWLLSYA